ncbi:hypothetical protein K8I61_06525 [bacterium]|nr:hypothetical protein [bacterium]
MDNRLIERGTVSSWLLRAISVIAVIVAMTFVLAGPSHAQGFQTRTIYVIGSINGAFTFPLQAYSYNAGQFNIAETWRPAQRDGGPVGLAVDPYVQRLFVSYEFSGALDIFNATDASPIGTVQLSGSPNPDDLAGMSVLESLGHLFVVDRQTSDVWRFDTTNFNEIDKWNLPTGNGSWGIDVIEDVNGVDAMFVGDTTNIVRWYDVDNHTEIGSATLLQGICIGVTVYMDGDDPVIFCTAEGGGHTPQESSWVHYYHTGTGTESGHYLGNTTGRGISVDQVNGIVFVVAAAEGIFGGKPTVRAIDVNTLQETGRTNLAGSSGTWSPTDLEATWLAFGGTVNKTCASHPNGQIDLSDEVVFEIKITNHASRGIHVLPLTDTYDTTQLTYLFSNPPSDDNLDDGQIDWTDLIAQVGDDLDFNETLTVEVHFLAQPDACETIVQGENTAEMHDAENDLAQPLDDATSVFPYTINCICLTDEQCDDGVWCNGAETCTEGVCVSEGNPCPLDDGLFCNGPETIVCVESTQECAHEGNPCADDGNWCNGEETCDEELDLCVESDTDPCPDDGLFCNGEESCSPNQLDCQHTGNPCDEDEICDEPTDSCLTEDEEPEPDDDVEAAADDPEFTITGGACGN